MADETSIYVSKPISVVVVTNHSPMFSEDSETLAHFDEMSSVCIAALEHMFLICADTTLGQNEFRVKFAEFQNAILTLRNDFFQATANLELKGFFTGRWLGTPYQRLPGGTQLDLTGGAAKEMPANSREAIRKLIAENEKDIDRLKAALSGAIKPSASEKSEPEGEPK